MSFFKKESGIDVLDLTMLQRRGLMPPSKVLQRDPRMGIDGTLDLTKSNGNISNLSNGESTPFSNFDNVNNVGNSLSQNNLSNNFTNNFNSPTESSFSSFFGEGATAVAATSSQMTPPQSFGISPPLEMNALKIKMEDMEYKLDRLFSRLDMIDGKLGNFERKIGL